MYEDRKMKNPVWDEMVQRNAKKAKETIKKGRSWKAQTSTDKGHKENDLTRIERRNPVLSRRLSFGKALLLNQTLISKLLQLPLRGGQNGPG
jgi:predicted amidohydrolase YtcJ